MRRHFEGLHQASPNGNNLPEGLFLVRVDRAQYRWHAQKPYYSLRLTVLEPAPYAGASITSRIYCSTKTLWKLNWFLHDFGYDTDLLGPEEIEDKHVVGLRGVVKISRVVINGSSLTKLDGFAPANQWEQLSATTSVRSRSEVAR